MTLTGTRIQSLSSQLSAASIAGTMFMVIDAASGGVSSKALFSDVANAVGTIMTNMTGLTTPLSVGQGGTGTSTLTLHGVLVGNGTAGVALTGTGSVGQPLVSGGASANPSYSTISSAMVSGLAAVATSGSYNSLSSLPTLANSASIAGATAATASTLALRDGSGGLTIGGLTTSGIVSFLNGTTTAVSQIKAGTNVTMSLAAGVVTISASGGGGGGGLPLATTSDPETVLEDASTNVLISTLGTQNLCLMPSGGTLTVGPGTGTSVFIGGPGAAIFLANTSGSGAACSVYVAAAFDLLSFFGVLAVPQQAANQAMTDNTGGTPSTTLANILGTLDDADINNNFASLNARLIEIRTLFTTYGLGT